MAQQKILNNNALVFIGLCNEYCQAVENAREMERDDFVAAILRILPRIYITATDINAGSGLIDEAYIDSHLDEDYYEAVRRNMENLFGPDDTYLEVFEEDMKYSDTPIAASVSEGLADLFQVFYNFLETIKNVPEELVEQGLVSIKEDFEAYWSRILCNLLRPLNQVRYSPSES